MSQPVKPDRLLKEDEEKVKIIKITEKAQIKKLNRINSTYYAIKNKNKTLKFTVLKNVNTLTWQYIRVFITHFIVLLFFLFIYFYSGVNQSILLSPFKKKDCFDIYRLSSLSGIVGNSISAQPTQA